MSTCTAERRLDLSRGSSPQRWRAGGRRGFGNIGEVVVYVSAWTLVVPRTGSLLGRPNSRE